MTAEQAPEIGGALRSGKLIGVVGTPFLAFRAAWEAALDGTGSPLLDATVITVRRRASGSTQTTNSRIEWPATLNLREVVWATEVEAS